MSTATETFDYAALFHPMIERMATLGRSLSPEQWTAPSLCDGWRVCDVFGHMTYGGVTPMYRVLPILLLKYRGNLNRGSAAESVRYADAHAQADVIAEFVRSSNDPVGIGKKVPPNELYVDHVVHELDIRRPLGLASEFDAHQLRAALAPAVAMKSPLIAPSKNAAGLRLVATDIAWAHGDASLPTVEGPAEDLLLALCGRPLGLAALGGDGVGQRSGRLTA